MARLQRHHINTGIYLGTSLLCKSVSVVLIPMYTKHLDRAAYGAYGLAQTLLWIAPTIISLGVGMALARFYFDDQDPTERARRFGAISLVIVGLSAALGLVAELVFGIAPGLRFAAFTPLQHHLLVWTCALTPIGEIPPIWLRAAERAGRYATFQLSVFGITAVTSVTLVAGMDKGLDGIFGGLFAGQVLAAIISLVFVFGALRPRFDRALSKQATLFSLPFIPHLIGNSFMVGTDRWVLERAGFRDELGLYTLATQLTLPISLATSAWNEASSPRFFAVFRDGGRPAAQRAFPRLVFGFVLAGALALVAVLVALPFIRLFVGDRFVAAMPLVPWIGGSTMIGLLFSAFVNVLQLNKRTAVIPLVTTASVAVNLGMNLWLVPLHGVSGAILGTTIAYVFRNLVLCGFAVRALYSDVATSS